MARNMRESSRHEAALRPFPDADHVARTYRGDAGERRQNATSAKRRDRLLDDPIRNARGQDDVDGPLPGRPDDDGLRRPGVRVVEPKRGPATDARMRDRQARHLRRGAGSGLVEGGEPIRLQPVPREDRERDASCRCQLP